MTCLTSISPDGNGGPLRIKRRPDVSPDAAYATFDILERWEERWEFAGACDGLSRAIAFRTYFALREEAAMFIRAEINCRMRQRMLAGWGIEADDLAHVIQCFERLGRARGKEWQQGAEPRKTPPASLR